MISFRKYYFRTFQPGAFAYAALFFSTLWAYSASAACLPGLPCETKPSAAQLLNPETGPNSSKDWPAVRSWPAGPTRPNACDANFMNQIYAKAFIEAEREMVITNATITKPDSVLEYTCFDYLAARVATIAGPIFSESTRWHPVTVNIMGESVTIDVFLGNTHLDRSIENLVLQGLDRYGEKSFPYDFLAGAAVGDNHDFSPTVAGASGVCDHMYNMHYISKCEDFGLNVPFMTFESYFSTPALLNTDPRTKPKTCPGTHQITPMRVEIAKNKDWSWAAFDKVDTLLPILKAPASGSGCANATPIPTGVMVKKSTYAQDLAGNPIMGAAQFEYEEKVCTNPACYFDNKDNANPADDVCKAAP